MAVPLLDATMGIGDAEGFQPVTLETDRGPVEARYYPVPGGDLAVLWVGGVGDLSCPILLIHGEADEILPPSCSIHVYRKAREPKKLVLVPGTGHALDEASEAVCREVRDQLKENLLKW